MSFNISATTTQIVGRATLATAMICAIYILLSKNDATPIRELAPQPIEQLANIRSASSWSDSSTIHRVGTRPIEQIKVGDRVIARNPEISDIERATWEEPDWEDWTHLSLLMPKLDGTELKIELLRPKKWVQRELACIFYTDSEHQSRQAEPHVVSFAEMVGTDGDHLGVNSDARNASEDELRVRAGQLVVPLNLPEVGASGYAAVVGINSCPKIDAGLGRVVTATFSHPPSTGVFDVVFSDSEEKAGVTDNHLFWSVDQQAFVPIGKMAIGERVLCYSGETKRIEQKLPRPGPKDVYNIEVHGEHVYFVGSFGILVHNEYETTFVRRQKRTNKNSVDWETGTRGKGMAKGKTNKQKQFLADLASSAWEYTHGNVSLYLKQMNRRGVVYKDAVIQLGPFAVATIKISKRKFRDLVEEGGRHALHKHADELLAKELKKQGVPGTLDEIQDSIATMRKGKKDSLTWHEDNNQQTLHLVPWEVNAFWRHLGGVKEAEIARGLSK